MAPKGRVVALADDIRSRGHWWIVIAPADHVEGRLPYRELEATVAKAKVQLRGWDFPHLDRPGSIRRRMSSIAQETDWNYYREIWEFFQTGQFTYLIGIHEDWTERSLGWGPPPHLVEQGRLLGIGDALFRLTETLAFASRLSQTSAGGNEIHTRIEIHGLRDRRLWVDSPSRMPFDGQYVTDVETYVFEDTIDRQELIANFRSIAVDQALELYARFGWNPTRELVEGQQGELRGVSLLSR